MRVCVRVRECVTAAVELVLVGDTRKTDTSKSKDVKKDGGTQEERGERLVKFSKYVFLIWFIFAVRIFCSKHAHRLSAADGVAALD